MTIKLLINEFTREIDCSEDMIDISGTSYVDIISDESYECATNVCENIFSIKSSVLLNLARELSCDNSIKVIKVCKSDCVYLIISENEEIQVIV